MSLLRDESEDESEKELEKPFFKLDDGKFEITEEHITESRPIRMLYEYGWVGELPNIIRGNSGPIVRKALAFCRDRGNIKKQHWKDKNVLQKKLKVFDDKFFQDNHSDAIRFHGDAEEIAKLASLAKENGKNNLVFPCLFMLGKLEDHLHLLIDSNRIPESALMARSYLPSKVSEIVALWRKDLNKASGLTRFNCRLARNLQNRYADPEEYPNMFEDWQIALEVKAKAVETRGSYPPAVEYVNYVDRSHTNLVETFKNMKLDVDEPRQNGDLDHENGNEKEFVDGQEVIQNEIQEEGVVAMDNDSADGAVLVNSNAADEE